MGRLRIGGLLAGCCLVAALGCGARPTPPAAIAPARKIADPEHPVTDFTLTERSGKKVSKADLKGKVWVASFIFTRCATHCPQVTGTLARLQKELADQRDVRLLTITVDPERDDPAELKRYADSYNADPKRWLFLTGAPDEVRRLLKEGFLVHADRAKPADGKEAETVDHSAKLAVIDKEGRIRGFFDGMPGTQPDAATTFEANLTQLIDRVVELAREQ